MPDQCGKRGRRHPLAVVLALTACATLVVGGDSVAAIWQWAARSSQAKLERLGARRDAFTGRFVVPSERTFRRVLADLDADAVDAATCRYRTESETRIFLLVSLGDRVRHRDVEQERATRGPPGSAACAG